LGKGSQSNVFGGEEKEIATKKRVDEISKTLKSAFFVLKPLLLRQSENYATDIRKFLTNLKLASNALMTVAMRNLNFFCWNI
jgi:hypothetical protein